VAISEEGSVAPPLVFHPCIPPSLSSVSS
jgi:hypothetical protein